MTERERMDYDAWWRQSAHCRTPWLEFLAMWAIGLAGIALAGTVLWFIVAILFTF